MCIRDSTNAERRSLAAWITGSADGQVPKDRTKISTKIKEMLKARHKFNKDKKWRAGCVLLNQEEKDVVKSKEPRLSKTFFEGFYPWCRADGIKIEEGLARSQDEKRAVKMTEPTIERHFHGEFGLENELIDAGIMDPESKVCMQAAPRACAVRALRPRCAHSLLFPLPLLTGHLPFLDVFRLAGDQRHTSCDQLG